METTVDFASELFRPYLPDDAQVNPGRYGAELAFWLSRKLAEHGVVTSYPNFEDWGWFLDYAGAGDQAYRLCCANRDGADDRWRCWRRSPASARSPGRFADELACSGRRRSLDVPAAASDMKEL